MPSKWTWRAAAAVALCGAGAAVGPAPAEEPGVAAHGDAVRRIIDEATTRGRSFAVLQHLTDRIGPRLSGSAGAAEAVRFTSALLRADGFDVRLEPVMVPHWVRGEETAEIVDGTPRRLALTALGGSIGTPAEGITAEVVVVPTLEALRTMSADEVRGRIVLFNRKMVAESKTDGYGMVVDQRTKGADEASRLGAVASLIRSVGTLDARLVHTGAVTYKEPVPKIPAAALAAEDADLLARLDKTGAHPKVHLRLGCRILPDALSQNVVADLRGRERPDEIVLIGAHLDSWDLGTGAHDDGAGVAIVMDALRVLKAANLVPRRTVRAVLFMNEENGLHGAKEYAADHAAELPQHVAAIESDSGGFPFEGFVSNVDESGLATLRAISALLAPLGPGRITAGGGGADIGGMKHAAVPLLGLDVLGAHYFDWHHSPADTLDKVDPAALARDTAAIAAMAYVLAEMPATLPRPSPSPSPSPLPSPAGR